MTEKESTRGATAKTVAPLIVVNALTVYGQLAYAYESIAPATWPVGARVILSIGFALAVESVALYIQWHAHDALLLRSHSTARSLRRTSFLVALIVGAMNYSHFTVKLDKPTAAGIAFGMLSLLSPWMWGLHSRRQARIQLLKERRVDDAGAEFSTTRKRMFPVRSWMAYRWSIDQNETDPVRAWNGYKADASFKSIFDRKGRVRKDATMDEMLAWADAHLPKVDVVEDVPVEDVVDESTQEARPVRTSSKVASWDVELAVKMLMDGRVNRTNEEIMEATGVTAKPLQLLRRCVRFLAEEMDETETAARVPCSLAHVQRVKAAMA